MLKHFMRYCPLNFAVFLQNFAELTISSLGHQFGCSSNGLGENTYNAFPHSRDDPFGLAADWTLHFPVPLEVLHGLVHNACYCSCNNNENIFDWCAWLNRYEINVVLWNAEIFFCVKVVSTVFQTYTIQSAINWSHTGVHTHFWATENISFYAQHRCCDEQSISGIIIQHNQERCKQLFDDDISCLSWRLTGDRVENNIWTPLLWTLPVVLCVPVKVSLCVSSWR